MILLIDAGNTRIKLGWIQPGTGLREIAAAAFPHGDYAALTDWLQHLPQRPHAAIGVNVAGESAANGIESLLEKECRLQAVTWVTAQASALGVRNSYQTPAQLGADRWVAMLGLAERVRAGLKSQPASLQPPCLLASFGTATTLDTLSSTGSGQFVFCGGLILPGAQLMRASLANGTANLPDAQGETVAYPNNTHQAIVTGIAAAQAGAVMRQWLIGLEQHGQAPQVYASGGAWSIVQKEVTRLLGQSQMRMGLPLTDITVLSTPVLDGLACLALTP